MLYNKDRLETAYSNVALIADSAWASGGEYVRANQELLVYECRLKRRNKSGMARTVLDTIPNSRLAQYGHYVYDEVRESCYTTPTATGMGMASVSAISHSQAVVSVAPLASSCVPDSPLQPQKQPQENPDNSPNLLFDTTQINSEQEAWMSEEVEKIFNIINDPNSRTRDLERNCLLVLQDIEERNSQEAYEKTMRQEELDGALNIHLRNLWDTPSNQINTAHHHTSALNADVPEFYPKMNRNHNQDNMSIQDDYISPRPRRELAYAYEPYLSYGYPVRAHEFRGLDTLMEGLRVLPTPALVPPALAAAQAVTAVTAQSNLPQQPQANQRRLYSAVLQNSPPSQVDEDELERQAMEQYRRGDDVIAQQFQELERLAEEQYSIPNDLASTLSSSSTTGTHNVQPGNPVSPRRSIATTTTTCTSNTTCSMNSTRWPPNGAGLLGRQMAALAAAQQRMRTHTHTHTHSHHHGNRQSQWQNNYAATIAAANNTQAQIAVAGALIALATRMRFLRYCLQPGKFCRR